MAREVTIEVEGLFVRDEQDYISGDLQQYLGTARSISPGSGHRVMWRAEADPDSKHPEAGASASAQAVVNYLDSIGVPHEDHFDLSIDLYGAISPIPTEGSRAIGKGLELANVERALRTLNQHVGELRR